MSVCPHCGSVSDDHPAEAGFGERCAHCGQSVAATTTDGVAAARGTTSEPFADLEDVLRETAAPLADIDDILSEVHVPAGAAAGRRLGLIARFGVALAGLAVAGLLVFGLGKIAELAEQAPQQDAAAGGAARSAKMKTGASAPASDPVPQNFAPLNDGWTPEPEWVEALGPAVRVGDYELRLPQDYQRVEQSSGAGKTTCSFRSLNRSADDLNVVTALIDGALADRGGVPDKLDPDWELDFTLDGYRSALAHFAETGRDQGRLADRDFVRGRFRGKQAGVEVHGVMLASYAERRMIVLTFVGADPPGSAEYKRLENALLTFRLAK